MSASRSTLSPVTVPSRLAVMVMSWIWSRPWCAASMRLRAGLGPLDRLAELPRDQERHQLLGQHAELAAETAADVRGDHPQLVLRDAERQRRHHPQDVRHLGGRPHGELRAGRVDDAVDRGSMNAGISRCWRKRRLTTTFGGRRWPPRRRRRCRPRRSRRPRARCGWCRGSAWTSGGAVGEGGFHVEHDRQRRRTRPRSPRARRRASAALRATTTATPSPAKFTLSAASIGRRGCFMSGVIGHAHGMPIAAVGIEVGRR